MKKKVLIALILFAAVSGGAAYYFIFAKNAPTTTAATQTGLTAAQEQGQPARSPEIKGVVKSREGNELILANEINTEELTDEEKAAKKAERQAMSQEERQALKAEETAQAETEQVTIVIPVGVTIKTTTSDATGQLIAAELSDIKSGTYVSIWVTDYESATAEVEFIKIRPIGS